MTDPSRRVRTGGQRRHTRSTRRQTATARQPAPAVLAPPPPTKEEDVRAAWPVARAFMQRAAGVVLADDQHYLLEARVRPLVRAAGHATVTSLVMAASVAPPGSPQYLDLVDALTTHETFFFRDAAFWRALEETILPSVLKELHGAPLTVWCAACSTGQEPHSVAMLLAERWPEVAAKATIIGTDIAEPTLARARLGVYTTLEVNRGLSAQRLVRHFDQVPGGLRLKEQVRRPVQLRRMNLLGPEEYPRAHLVLCRNVLIYFNDVDRTTVQRRLSAAASHYVGVGCTERIGAHLPISPGWFDARLLRTPAPARSP